MAAKKAKLMVVVGADTKDYQKKMKAMSKNLDGLSQKLKGFGSGVSRSVGVGLASAGAAIGAFAAQGVRGAAELEAYRNTLDVVMKDSQKAGELMNWAVEFANKTPFETDSIIEATVRLQAYGISAQDTMSDIGDMASVMNKDLMSAVEAVADAQTGELERLKEFGITKQMIIDHADKIMKGKQVVNAKGQIIDQKNFNKVLFDLMRSRYKGGMEIQANSFNGLMSTLQGTFKSALSQMVGVSATGEIVVGGLFDTLKEKMKLLIAKIEELKKNGTLEKWADKISETVPKVWKTLEEDVFPLIRELAEIIGKVVTGFLDLPGGAQKAVVALGLLGGPSLNLAGNLISIASSLLLMKARAPVAGAAMAAAGATANAGWLPLLGTLGAAAAIIGGLSAAGYLAKKGGDMKSDRLLGDYPSGGGRMPSHWDEKAQDKVIKHINNVSGYANGGIVTRKTLAWVGEKEPEVITPLSKLRGAMGGGQTVNHTGTITVKGVNSRDELIGVTQILARDIAESDRRLPNRTKLIPI